MTETYSLSLDFPTGLLNDKLKDIINDDVGITASCNDIDTDGDSVMIKFNNTLSAGERTTLDGIVSSYIYTPESDALIVDSIDFIDYDSHHVTKLLSNVAFSAGVVQTLTNWSNSSGTLSGFNNVSGEMVFSKTGLYCFGINALVQTSGNNNNIMLRVYDENNVTRFIETQELNDLSPEAPGGACSFTAPNMMYADEKLKVECKFSQNETCNFVLKIIKLL